MEALPSMRSCPRLLAVAFVAALAACTTKATPPPPEVTLQGLGTSVHVVADPFSLEVLDADGSTALATAQGPRFTLDARTTEAQLVPGWDGTKHHEKPWTTFTHGVLTSVSETSATVTFTESGATVKATVSVSRSRPRVALSAAIDDAKHFNTAGLSFALAPDSHFFGMGQRTATVDHLGQSLYSWPEEGGLGGGEDAGPGPQNPYPNGPSMTYFPVPFFHTTHGVSVLVDTTRRSEVRFGIDASLPGTLGVVVEGQAVPLVLYVRPSPLEAIDDYTADTGRPPLPAPWAYGPRRRINREGMVDGVPEWQLMRDRRLPLTTIDDAMHSLPSFSQKGHEATYQAWTALVHAHGYKVMDYNNPYVSASAPNSASDYAFGAAQGFFEEAPDGGPATTFFLSGGAQTVSAIDLTDPAAVSWFEGLLSRSFALGYDGWMHDFGEYVARTSRFADGRTGDELHNAYPVLSARAASDAVQAHGGDAHVFTRSGYTGSQQWVLENWGGDPEASFDDTIGLPGLLRGGLNLGLVGEPYWSSDIGGYKCLTSAPHDREMLVRWYEMSALSPMMHDEDACANPLSGGQVKARLWDDTFTQDVWRTQAGLHTRLAPYFRALAVVAHRTGAPITRHPVLAWPSRPEAWTVEDSFFVGDGLYGAPVVRRGLAARKVWLPPGRFVEWTTRALFQGPATVDVPAPLERLPLFLVEDQLVPLLDAEVQTLAPSDDVTVVTEASRADVLDVVALLSANGAATLTLADGTVLTATRVGSQQGNPEGLGPAGPSTIGTCSACWLKDTSGDVARVRLNVRGSGAFGDVRVEAKGGPERVVRWELLELP